MEGKASRLNLALKRGQRCGSRQSSRNLQWEWTGLTLRMIDGISSLLWMRRRANTAMIFLPHPYSYMDSSIANEGAIGSQRGAFVFSFRIESQPRKEEVAAGIVNHVDLTGIEARIQRREWHIQLKHRRFSRAGIEVRQLD